MTRSYVQPLPMPTTLFAVSSKAKSLAVPTPALPPVPTKDSEPIVASPVKNIYHYKKEKEHWRYLPRAYTDT